MGTVAVVGGGMAGLATALFAARRGHEVTVVERGASPPEGDADALAAWDRHGVAQARFAHFFKARSTRVLREEAPDVLTELFEVGVGRTTPTFGTGFEDDAAMHTRRLVLEGVLHRTVADEPGIVLVHSSARRLLTHGHRVVGVGLRDGTELAANLVVDAAGRRSASARWLRDVGFDPPAVVEHPSGQHYYTRHYRLRAGDQAPTAVPAVQPLPYAVVLVFGGDNGTFSVAASFSADDPLRLRLHDPEVFDRFLRELPLTAAWLDHAEPASDLHVMAGLSNRHRWLTTDGAPGVAGLALVGDAALYTNPALGHGVSLSFWMAQRLAASLERFEEDAEEATRDYQAWIAQVLGQWFEGQVEADRGATRQFTAGIRGDGFLPPADAQGRFAAAVTALRGEDETLDQLANRIGHLLEVPASLREDPSIAARVEALLAAGTSSPPPDPPLSRTAFGSLVSDGAPTPAES